MQSRPFGRNSRNVAILLMTMRTASLILGKTFTHLFLLVYLMACSDERSVTNGTGPRGADYYPAWSPDGRTIAFFSQTSDDSTGDYEDRLTCLDLSSEKTTVIWRVPNGPAVWDLTWSPDSEWLVYSSDVGIYRIRSKGDSLQQLTSGQFHRSPTWSSKSGRIYFVSARGLFSMQPDGSGLRRELEGQGSFGALRAFWNSDTLLATTFQPLSGSECFLLALPASEWVGDTVSCNVNLVDHIRIDRPRVQVLFLGRPSIDAPFAIYRMSRFEQAISRIAEGHSFDMGPNDSTIVVADVDPPRGLRLIHLYTGVSTPITRQPLR